MLIATGGAIGLLLSAPVILLFAQYLPQSFNIHSDLAHEPPRTVPVGQILNLLMPRIATTDRGWTRNWTGVAAVLLAAVAIAGRRSMRRYVGWPFVAMGGLVALQSFGGDLVAWTRHIPLWSQGFWPFFGTPVISFAIAVLAGIGVQAIADRDVGPVRFLVAIAAVCGLAGVLVLHARAELNLDHEVFVLGGWPLAIAVVVAVAAVALFLGRRFAAPLIVAVILAEMLLLAPGDVYAARQDPYPSRSWIGYVQDNIGGDGARVVSSDGLLFPNTASVYGLSDIRMLDALYPDRWWKYLRTFVSRGIVDRFTATAQVEGAPNLAGNRMLDVLGLKYALYKQGGGAPPEWSGDQYRLVFRGDGVNVYQNTHAVPRPFVVHDVHAVRDDAAARSVLRAGRAAALPRRRGVGGEQGPDQDRGGGDRRSTTRRRGRLRARSDEPRDDGGAELDVDHHGGRRRVPGSPRAHRPVLPGVDRDGERRRVRDLPDRLRVPWGGRPEGPVDGGDALRAGALPARRRARGRHRGRRGGHRARGGRGPPPSPIPVTRRGATEPPRAARPARRRRNGRRASRAERIPAQHPCRRRLPAWARGRRSRAPAGRPRCSTAGGSTAVRAGPAAPPRPGPRRRRPSGRRSASSAEVEVVVAAPRRAACPAAACGTSHGGALSCRHS